MIAIFFDIDDTLYDQFIPFEKAFNKQFNQYQIDVEELYKRSRILSDSVFELSESGIMSSVDMKIYRIQEACKQMGLIVTREQSLMFQSDYECFQKQITLSKTMEDILNYCKAARVTIGIITNGPSSHQEMKVQRLNLARWIPANRILISSQVGVAKPDSQIFKMAERRLAREEQIFYYVGDNITNDIKGATSVGWKAIWLNRRHQLTEKLPQNSIIANTEEELLEYIKDILSVMKGNKDDI